MLKPEDNELLTRVGPGTAMGLQTSLTLNRACGTNEPAEGAAMHRPTTILAVLALVLSIPGETTPQSSSDAHVILISLDGFAASRLEDEELELPNLRAVARSGAWAKSSQTVFPSTDDPAHTSILTGVPPRLHGVIGNRMHNRETGEYFRVTNKPRTESVKVPTLFDAAKLGLSP